MKIDVDYYRKIQGTYKFKNKREADLFQANKEAEKHWCDTYATKDVLINDKPSQLMVIKDTDGNIHKKKIKSLHDKPFNLGDYVKWNGRVWIVAKLDPDDKVWNSGYMYLCNMLLRFKNKNGKIIERWGFAEDYTKYSNGITGSKDIQVGNYQYGVTVPVDEETKHLKRGVRFPIDLDGIEPPDVYKLTSRKIKIDDNIYFGRGGLIIWTLSLDFYSRELDKKIKLSDGREVWVCDISRTKNNEEFDIETDTTEDTNTEKLVSYYKTPNIRHGDDFKLYEGSEDGSWNIDLHNDEVLERSIISEIKGNELYLKSMYDSSLIGKSFTITYTLKDKKENINVKIIKWG